MNTNKAFVCTPLWKIDITTTKKNTILLISRQGNMAICHGYVGSQEFFTKGPRFWNALGAQHCVKRPAALSACNMQAVEQGSTCIKWQSLYIVTLLETKLVLPN